jgi:hypothetical protein
MSPLDHTSYEGALYICSVFPYPPPENVPIDVEKAPTQQKTCKNKKLEKYITSNTSNIGRMGETKN